MLKRKVHSELDFAQWHREYMESISFAERPASSWDKRAQSMQNKGSSSSKYIDAFIDSMDFDGVSTVLDVGSGTGTLALQIAPQVEHVYCLDYSRAMLDYVEINAQEAGLDNISTIHLSKEDDWQELVPQVDVLISSRSGLDGDVENLFNKFNRYAKRHIYYSYLVGGRFDQPEISKLLNKDKKAFPDYIHVVNVLYEMGIDPELSFVDVPGRLQSCKDEEGFLKLITAQYGELTASDISLLKDFYHQEALCFAEQKYTMKWALINWSVPEKA